MDTIRRCPASRVALIVLLCCLVPLAAPAQPLASKVPLGGMVDARVNLKTSYQSATAARPGAASAGLTAARQQGESIAAAVADFQRTMPGLEVTLSGFTAGPSQVRNKSGALTEAAPGRASEDIVREFLGQHGAIYGLSAVDLGDLVALGDSPGGSSGLRMLRMEQRIGGLPVFQSETRFLLDRDGRLVKSVGLMVPQARVIAPRVDPSRLLTPEAAVSRLLAAFGRSTDPSAFAVTADRGEGRLELSENDQLVAGPITARQVLFPLGPGLLVPAWSLVVFTEGDEDWYAVVDAETGDLLWRKNIRDYVSAHDARFRVYVQADGTTPADSPAPQSPNTVTTGSGTQFGEIAPTIVSMHTAYSATASPNGWIDDCPAGICATVDTDNSTEQTVGNNVRACMDRTVGGAATNQCDIDAASTLDGFGKPTGNPDTNGRNRDFLGIAPRDFQTGYLPPPQGGAGGAEAGQTATGTGAAFDQFRRGAVTQLFYVANWYHDQLFALGFDEPAGNFQQTNFQGLGGVGGDRVLGDAQDGSSTNNANFSTPPDGTSGRAQMFRFTGPTIDRDGDLDSEVLMHEFTHGTSNRLVGNAAGLNWDTARGMGEGWSDFVAMSLLNNTNADSPAGHYGSGAYATYKLVAGFLDNYLYGIRRFPYTTDNSVNPMTWADVDDVTNNLAGGIPPTPVTFNLNGGAEVHNSGEIWALTLWEVRSRVIADPAGANGDVPTGNQTMLRMVINGLKMTPIDPSFLDARDAIIDGDCAASACANEDSIWGGFADRGLGYGAKEPYHIMGRFVRSHIAIGESFSLPFLDVVNAATDVAVDDSASNNNGRIDPGEAVKITVTLTNPWRAASKAVTGATATLSTTTPGVTIFDNTSAYGAIAPQGTAAGDTFTFSVASTVLCGSAIDFTLTTVSNLGTTSTSFRLRVGNPSGTDPVVTYTGDPNPDLTILDNRPRGVFHQITITDDFEIADLDFRLDSITHTFPGDVTAMLRSPGGIGTDFVSLIGAVVGQGAGPNIANMVIDDDLVSSPATDMTQAPDTSAPYTASWLPVYNAPWITLQLLTPDPVPNLSLYDGTSTQGVWSALVADNFNLDSGTFNAWSMIVTPRHFACSIFGGAAVVSATKTVSGTFTAGGTVTYTVTLTNSGTAVQGDNPGNEFTDVLPPCVTLVSAVASSGTAGTGGNTVTWNGTLAPLGGTVTITITATVNAGAPCSTCSNQGTVSYDSDNNGTNNATALTDDPAVGGASDPTSFTIGGVVLSATKTLVGGTASCIPGGTITYSIVISNTGCSSSLDNAGNELTDPLPAGVTLVNATATSGTATNTNPVTWNGSVPASGSVTITITATINPATVGTLSNQATISYDADLNGTNETTTTSDDPTVGGTNDPTSCSIVGVPVVQIPTLSELGLLALGLSLLLAALTLLRRRARA